MRVANPQSKGPHGRTWRTGEVLREQRDVSGDDAQGLKSERAEAAEINAGTRGYREGCSPRALANVWSTNLAYRNAERGLGFTVLRINFGSRNDRAALPTLLPTFRRRIPSDQVGRAGTMRSRHHRKNDFVPDEVGGH